MSVIVNVLPATKTVSDPLTYEDYKTFPDNDGIRKEIIEGELFMSPAPSKKHQRILRKLIRKLDEYVTDNDLGEIFIAPFDVIFSDINVVQPDLIFLSKKKYEILTDSNIQGAPDLLIEILSPSNKENDRIFKKQIYEIFAVKEYWIVDPDTETVEIRELKNKKFQLTIKANKNQIIETQLLKGLRINLFEIFSD
ncbi:Uma2 family endonuclease [candidate division KSB1 bacterium]|nr:Uma2 family endonuclease [candidate division KSB1 bacterium]